jgi:hypothetical protein
MFFKSILMGFIVTCPHMHEMCADHSHPLTLSSLSLTHFLFQNSFPFYFHDFFLDYTNEQKHFFY